LEPSYGNPSNATGERVKSRKLDHVRICIEEDVESSYTGFEDVMLIHRSLPEVDLDEVDTSVTFLDHGFSAPLLIASMTGGHPETKVINANLAEAAEMLGIGMGVGSQRAAIEDESVVDTFSVVRDKAPNAFIYANIGIPQLIEKGVEIAEKAIEMIDADAIAIHLNFLQEAIQPEGETKAKGALKAIEEASKELKVPVIVKETGAGITGDMAAKLKECGVDAVDVGGKGGTSWSGVEVYRLNDEVSKNIGKDFWNWGIPTAFCVVETRRILPTIATGGIRNGIDVAKSLALGASMASSALPFLHPATVSVDEVVKTINYFIRGLKTAMFLTGCSRIDELKDVEVFITGKLKEWMQFRGLSR
jgi:isopentenyl-diphosphate delta-isomerase